MDLNSRQYWCEANNKEFRSEANTKKYSTEIEIPINDSNSMLTYLSMTGRLDGLNKEKENK